jgi:hypothetical protein
VTPVAINRSRYNAGVARIFISYRKDDTRPWAINLRDYLAREFGERQVFLDVDSIDTGQWRTQIEHALDSCAVAIVLIGPRWIAASDPDGRKRLSLPDDVHRLEVATVLGRGMRVIPVLVDGARLPAPGDLPEDLRGLLECQISEIADARDARAAGLRRLTRSIDDLLGQGRERRRAIAVAAAAVILGVVNTLVRSESPMVATVFLLIAAVLGASSVGIYRRMTRQNMKGAWVALVAVILTAAIFVGSMVRLAVRMAQPARMSWNLAG